MPNRNYINGANKERRIVNKHRGMGHIAFRSAGSHSPIDICIINREEKKITFVQSKPKKFSKKKAAKISEDLSWINDEFMVDFKVL